MWNAFTYLDWTTFFETMPADKIDIALKLESDRMINSKFDPAEVASERTVIISEREGNENEPLFQLGEAMQKAAFKVHPYHYEIIGEMSDLKTMQREDLYHYYKQHYSPSNAVLAIAGDFNSAQMLDKINGYFAALQPQTLKYPRHPTRTGADTRGTGRSERPRRDDLCTDRLSRSRSQSPGFLPLHSAGQPVDRSIRIEHVRRRGHFQ